MSADDNHFYHQNQSVTQSTTAARVGANGTEAMQSTTTQSTTTMRVPVQSQTTIKFQDRAIGVTINIQGPSEIRMSQQITGPGRNSRSTQALDNAPNQNASSGSGYEVVSRGVNEQGNGYDRRDYGPNAPNQNAYRYSNRDGSYYYSNPNGSQYHNDGNRGSTYTTPNGWQVRR